VVPFGARNQFTARVRELVDAAGDQTAEELAAPENVKRWVSSLMKGVDVRDRTCMNLYAKVLRMVDNGEELLANVLRRLGEADEAKAAAYIAAAKSVEGAGPHEAAERCEAYLEAYYSMNEERRPAGIRRLGGYVPVEQG